MALSCLGERHFLEVNMLHNLALTLLSFCHPIEVHPLDFALHIAAIITIVAFTVLLGWRWVMIR